MCGRFVRYCSLKTIQKSFPVTDVTCEAVPSYNIAPAHEILTIIRHTDSIRLGKLHWGLVPPWAKDLSGAAKRINSRSETAAEKPSFRDAFQKKRCLILADGFYEWKKSGKSRHPWYFTLPEQGPFAFAGLWERWQGRDGQRNNSCAILTTAASESVQDVHDRMPVILRPDAFSDWLDPDNHNTKLLQDILNNCKVGELTRYEVSRKVNSPSVNDASCIEPLENCPDSSPSTIPPLF